jgi:signal transduction histidine kinase/CheY-like chemotaxis protein
LVRRDGSRVAVEVEALLVDFDGEPTVLLLVRDLTERRDMLARMAVADRMRSVGMLAAGVAHEINNPLTYVLGNLSLVVDELRRPARRLSPERIAQLLADAHDGALRVRDVVRDLRVLSRADGELVGAVELREVLESCLKMASNEVRFRARIVSRLDPTPPVRGTASRLGQVFLNLLINAAHSIAEGHPDDNAITVTTRPLDPQTVVVEITDTGCGIPPSLIGRIFDPFFTTKPPGVGTGLGLAICHGIIKTLGGNIDVQSEPGRGSTVRVTLPVAPPVETREERRAPRVAVPRRGSVLVVDDEPAIGSALRTLLQLEHDVVTVTRAVDALARIEAGERYDVVLCDVMMPEMSGVELFAAVERSNPGIASRFVFITGGAFTEASRAFLDGNKNPCLEKPLTLDTLRKTIAQVLGDP